MHEGITLAVRIFQKFCYMFIFITTSRTALSDVPEITAVLGGTAELPCNITLPSADDAISLILWYKGHSGPPFYSIDARNGLITKAKHFLNKSFNNRGFFDASTQQAVLRLTGVQEDDVGFYRCRVDYRWARTHSTVSELFVIVPPKEVVIVGEHEDKMSGVIGPFNEGESLTLTCEASGGIPSPSVKWSRDGKMLDDSYTVANEWTVKNDIHLSHLHRRDLLSTFDCQASNNNETLPVTQSVTLDLNLKPLDVRITSHRQPLIAGERTEFVCESFGARPRARIVWRKGGREVHKVKEDTSIDGNLTTSTLTFIPIRDDDEKYLSCRADNPILPSSLMEDGYLLKVHFVPQMFLAAIDGQTKVSAKEGSSVRLFCNITANPTVNDVAWYFKKKPLFYGPLMMSVVQNQTLLIENITRQDSGNYHCTSTNLVGKGESNDFILIVQYSPVCRASLKIAYGAARGETVKVICEVDADPAEITFTWKFNNTVQEKTVDTFVTHRYRSVASYTPRTMNDFGNLYCWGQNIIGRQLSPCMFSIIPAGPPDPVENCLVTNYTTDTVTVECQAGDNNGLQSSYFLEIYNTAKNQMEHNTSRPDLPNFHIIGLTPGTPYLLVLYAANVKGRSEPITVTAYTKPSAQKQVRKEQGGTFSPLLGIFTGVILAMVLGAVIIIVVLRYRRQRQDREIQIDDSKSSTEAKPEGKGFPSSQNSPDVVPLRSDYYGRTNGMHVADNWNQDQEWLPVRCVRATQKYYDNLGTADRQDVELAVFHQEGNEVRAEDEVQRLYTDQSPCFQGSSYQDDMQWPELDRRYCTRAVADMRNSPCSSYYDDLEVPTWPSRDVRIKSTMI